jgi:predicted metal-dependent peptidase
MPVDVELLVDKLQRSQIDWKTILLRNVQSVIPYDYNPMRPSKRSISSGFYSPDYLKERVEVLIAIDTSGSIGQTELTEFVSEMVGLAKGYQDRIEMRVLTHDVEVHDDYLLSNGAAYKINQLKIHGGGGTSHEPVLELIKTKYPRTKLAIFLTDGHSDLENLNLRSYPFRKIVILNKYGKDVKDLVLNDDTRLIKLK